MKDYITKENFIEAKRKLSKVEFAKMMKGYIPSRLLTVIRNKNTYETK